MEESIQGRAGSADAQMHEVMPMHPTYSFRNSVSPEDRVRGQGD